ncbi:hypothetical protein FA13DRAFT_537859 [Coprinellus micaceus]|uniref:F-box domain-containing protein n=1 Tax=Coprinellus micaceus TaxID=71717 RepID=A0A4Y7SD34_COPMI|nr:hypothetical protein FA13DRAFT_537859 [Coprinellus micaceus]
MFQRFRKPKSSAAVVPEPPKVAREGPLDRLFRSNKLPTDDQRQHINAILHELKTRYQQTCGVTYSDPRTGPIPALGQEIHEEIKRYQSLFSCIRTMPNEIWHTMFEHVVLIVKPGYDQIHAVQTIRLVCRRWESAARKCATLWQNLPLLDLTNIPMSERKEIAFEKATNHLHSYLQRSVNMPISFTFHFWPDLFPGRRGDGTMDPPRRSHGVAPGSLLRTRTVGRSRIPSHSSDPSHTFRPDSQVPSPSEPH